MKTTKKLLMGTLLAVLLGSLASCILVDRPGGGRYDNGRTDNCHYRYCR
jgi:hypothetical protein